jgi:hypothetical protein
MQEAFMCERDIGELARSEGKIKNPNISGMSVVSAQDYITDFLAMREGKEYHRTNDPLSKQKCEPSSWQFTLFFRVVN